MNNEIYIAFAKWLDSLLEIDMPKNTKAFNFNLYEEEDNTYGIQLIASDKFDENDHGEWACSETWSSQEDVFYIDHSDETDCKPEDGMAFISSLIKEYIRNGKYSGKLTNYQAIGIGFVDGDLKILFN